MQSTTLTYTFAEAVAITNGLSTTDTVGQLRAPSLGAPPPPPPPPRSAMLHRKHVHLGNQPRWSGDAVGSLLFSQWTVLERTAARTVDHCDESSECAPLQVGRSVAWANSYKTGTGFKASFE